MEAAPSSELSRWIAYFTYVDAMPDGHLDAALQAHATACAAWSGEGRPPRFEDFLITAPGAPDEEGREETAEESTARILRGFGFPTDG